MRNVIKEFLKPNWRKVLVFLLLFIITCLIIALFSPLLLQRPNYRMRCCEVILSQHLTQKEIANFCKKMNLTRPGLFGIKSCCGIEIPSEKMCIKLERKKQVQKILYAVWFVIYFPNFYN